MDRVRIGSGVTAGCIFIAQAVTSLALRPSAGDNYSATTGDIVNDSVFALGLILLAVFLTVDARGERTIVGRLGGVVSGAGCLMLAASVLVTVAAGHERWNAVYIIGFALAELGFVTTVVSRRSFQHAAMVLGMVVCLAFFDRAGGAALGLGVVLAGLTTTGLRPSTQTT